MDNPERLAALQWADSYRVIRGNPARGMTGGFCREMRRLHLLESARLRREMK